MRTLTDGLSVNFLQKEIKMKSTSTLFACLLFTLSTAILIGYGEASAQNLSTVQVDTWSADGYRENGTSNSSSVTYTEVKKEDFANKTACQNWIKSQNNEAVGDNPVNLVPSISIKGSQELHKVRAVCTKVVKWVTVAVVPPALPTP